MFDAETDEVKAAVQEALDTTYAKLEETGEDLDTDTKGDEGLTPSTAQRYVFFHCPSVVCLTFA